MNKLLTIIIPSYNMEKYLERCCSSLVVDDAELMARLEVLVVNDGSTDQTSEIGHAWEAKHPGVFRVIDKPNGHYGSCVNRGLAEAKGVFVKVLDADDYCERANFGALVAELVKHEESDVDLVVSDFVDVDGDGHVVHGHPSPPFAPCVPLPQSECPLPARRLALHMIVYRTERVRLIGYRQTEGVAYTDTEWVTTPMAAVRKALYFPRVVTNYLIGRNGQTMDPATYARDFQVVVKLVIGLVERCRELNVEREGARLYRNQLKHSVGMVYAALSPVNSRYREYTGDLREFDRRIGGAMPEFRAVADEVAAKSRVFPFRPYPALRKYGTFNCPPVWLYLAYQAIADLIKKFIRRNG